MSRYYHNFVVAISFLYLLSTPTHLCLTIASKKSTGFSLKLIHRDSPESPLYPGNLTSNERMSRYAKWSIVRASHLASMATKNVTIADDPNTIMRPPVYLDGAYYYMVSLGIGTPMQNILLHLDTGASLTWTQCEPCENCYHQTTPIYNSASSRTFQPIHCNHPLCSDILECNVDTCWYVIIYGGGSRTMGLAMTDALTFGTDDQHLMVIHDMVLGCSHNSIDFPFSQTGNIGGILGLNPSPHSLVSQLDGIIERKFSYCLTPGQRVSSYLRFGSDIVMRGTGPVQKIPFVRLGTYYFGLNLIDISISDRRLHYPDGTFAPRAGGAGGCFIDSGAPFSVIDQPAFNTFIAAFENFFAPTRLVRNTNDCREPTTYCYYSQGLRAYPSITLHFEGGANYIVPPENVIWPDPSGQYFMLTIIPADRTIIGAWQQHNVRLVYDLHEGYLSFVPENCSNDVN